MENSEKAPPTYPFSAADMDIDMIERAEASPNGQPSPVLPTPSAYAPVTNPAEMARQLAGAVQDLQRKVEESDSHRRQLENRLSSYENSIRQYEALRQTLRETVASPVTEEDLQALQRVLQALAQDPNHIMVLASVAQQVGKLSAVVSSFARLQQALKQAPPR